MSENERGTRLSADWKPSEQDYQFAAGQGLDDDQIRYEADKFADYWRSKAGSSASKRDWPAVWRNWCRRVAEIDRRFGRSGRRADRSGASSISGAIGDVLDSLNRKG